MCKAGITKHGQRRSCDYGYVNYGTVIVPVGDSLSFSTSLVYSSQMLTMDVIYYYKLANNTYEKFLTKQYIFVVK